MPDPNRDPGSPYGWDLCVDVDLAPDAHACSGALLVGNAMLHRLMEDTLPMTGAPGGVIDFGEDVRKWIGEVTTQASANAKAPRLVAVFNRDPRLDPAQTRVQVLVRPSLTFPNKAAVDLAIFISGALTNGTPISRVVGVSSATVAFIAQGT